MAAGKARNLQKEAILRSLIWTLAQAAPSNHLHKNHKVAAKRQPWRSPTSTYFLLRIRAQPSLQLCKEWLHAPAVAPKGLPGDTVVSLLHKILDEYTGWGKFHDLSNNPVLCSAPRIDSASLLLDLRFDSQLEPLLYSTLEKKASPGRLSSVISR